MREHRHPGRRAGKARWHGREEGKDVSFPEHSACSALILAAAGARDLFSQGGGSLLLLPTVPPCLLPTFCRPRHSCRPVFHPVGRFCMSATDLVLILLLVACTVLAFRRIVRRKGTGCCSGSAGTGGCSGGCSCGSSGCAGSCSAGLTAPLVRQSGDADASDASETSAASGTTDPAGTSGSSGTADASGSSASSGTSASSGVSASSGGSDSF